MNVVVATAAATFAGLLLCSAVSAQQAPQTIWSGVFSATQDMRGATVHSAVCARCHGATLNGAGAPDAEPSPAIARASFLFKWDGKTLAELFDYVKANMPHDNPSSRSDQEYVDAIAHMLALSGAMPGAKDLPVDRAALANIAIKKMP